MEKWSVGVVEECKDVTAERRNKTVKLIRPDRVLAPVRVGQMEESGVVKTRNKTINR